MSVVYISSTKTNVASYTITYIGTGHTKTSHIGIVIWLICITIYDATFVHCDFKPRSHSSFFAVSLNVSIENNSLFGSHQENNPD